MDIARIMGEISRDINRQIGILIDRTGHITHVMVGDHSSIEIPHLDRLRSTGNRLRGLRLIHTKLKVNALLAGILVMTALYSVILAIMGTL